MITWNSVLTTLPRTFCLKAANVSLNLQKRSKIVYIFVQKSISNEEVPMITDNAILTDLLRFFCHKAQKLFTRCPKMMKKWKFFQKNFYPKCSYGHVVCSFYNGAHKTIAQCLRKVEITQFLEKSYFSQKCSQNHVRCSFHKPADKFFPGVRKFFIHCPKLKEKKDFSKAFRQFLQNASMIFCTRGLHI